MDTERPFLGFLTIATCRDFREMVRSVFVEWVQPSSLRMRMRRSSMKYSVLLMSLFLIDVAVLNFACSIASGRSCLRFGFHSIAGCEAKFVMFEELTPRPGSMLAGFVIIWRTTSLSC